MMKALLNTRKLQMARTLEDVAKLTGYSRATVSRVLNDGPVAADTRVRVLEALKSSDYRPNVAARSLASGRTGVMGIVMHIAAERTFADAYFTGLLTGISEQLSEQSLGMMLWLGNRTKEETLDQIVGMGMLDGVIVTAEAKDDPLVDGLRASGMPTVLVGHRRADSDASYVDIDNEGSAEIATNHLLSLGRMRIGHITGRRDSVSGGDRILGFEAAMRKAGRSTEGLIVDGDFTPDGGYLGAKDLITQRVDAIFCGSDYTAVGALRAIKEAGLSVPGDIALVGFDDLAFAATMDPPLTTVRQDIGEIGHEAARSLIRLVGNPDAGPRRTLLPTEIVIRRSTVGDVR
jgi:DNA-binding LacI/PurR family transcriptional regulator